MGTGKLYKKKSNTKYDIKWFITIILWSMIISGGISLSSDLLLKRVNLLVAFIILVLIILVGVIFDIIGIAVTVGDETPFHAMASKKISEAKIAVKLIRNADKVSSFCNDVIGDISGIISGSIGILILAKVVLIWKISNTTIISALIGAVIAAITIGGKAFGKSFAINNSNQIIYRVSKLIDLFVKDR